MTLRRVLVVIAVLGLVWAVVVARSSGFVWHIGSFRISSRDPWRPLMVAVTAALGALALTPRDRIRSELERRWKWFRTAPTVVERLLHRGAVVRIAIAIAVAGIAVDVYQWSGGASFWLDEEMIALNIRDRSFGALSGGLWLQQSAPYCWLVLQRAVLLTLGEGERALRLVPLLFGLATVVAALQVGRRWLGAVGMCGLVLLCWISTWLSHYRFEVKHYSADAFFGLVLPALVVWAIEGDDPRTRVRRATIWWAAAAVGQFLANGALLVAPGCAVVLMAALWRRDGWRASGVAAIGGVLWLAALAGHYELSLRFTGNLREYWANQFPPRSTGAAGAQWFVNRLELLASNPAGSGRWLSLWLLAAAGFAFSRSRLAAVFAIVPVSAFAYAIAGLVPLYERFSIWIVPALYVGVMLLADRAALAIPSAWHDRRWMQGAVSIATLLLTFQLVTDIVSRGYDALDVPPPIDSHQLNDRSAVRWLRAQRRPGDTLVTTRLGGPAIWWYGRISIAHPDSNAIRSEGYVMTYEPPGPRCRASLDVPPDTHRLLVYLGFPDVPDGFERLLKQTLDQAGMTTGYQEYADSGRVFVVDLDRRSPNAKSTPPGDHDPSVNDLRGCVGIKPLRRW
jgi:hypothetical protein